MIISDKERKVMKAEAVKRLEYLVSWGIDVNVLKTFKQLGRVYVDEVKNDEIAKVGNFNTYLFAEDNGRVTDEMLQTKRELENKGYLVYLIVWSKRNSVNGDMDKIDYFIIDNPRNKIFYSIDDVEFRNGKAKAYVQYSGTTERYLDEVYYEIRKSHVIETGSRNKDLKEENN